MRCRALLVACVLLLAAVDAYAEPPHARPVQLVYTRGPGAEGCPGPEALRSAVSGRMGYDPFDQASARRLGVTISRKGGELVVAMSLHDEAGAMVWEESTIHTPGGCGPLVRAVGLALAIRLEPEPEPPAPPCPVCPAPPPPAPPPAPVPVQPPKPGVAPVKKAEAAGLLAFFGGGVRGALETQSPPSPGAVGSPLAVAPGAALFGGVRWPVFSLELETQIVLPGMHDNQLAQIRPLSIAGLLVPCAHYLWVHGCGLFTAGVTIPLGPDAPSPLRPIGLAGAGFRAGAERRIGRLLVRGHADVIGTLEQEHLVFLANPGQWNVPAVVGTLGLDIAVLFPVPSGTKDEVVSTSSTSGKDQ